LRDWIRDNRSSIALRNRLNNDVRLWQAKKTKEELWSGSKLVQVLDLRKDQTFNQVLGGFDREANDFIDASMNRRNHQRYRTVAVWTGFSTLVLLSVALFISLGTPWLATVFNNWGVEEQAHGNTTKAIKNYELALSFNRKYPLALFNLGFAYEDEKKFSEAIANYKNAITLSSGNYAPAYNALARLYILQTKNAEQNTSEAIKLLEKALRLPFDKELNQEELINYKMTKYAILKNLGWAKLKQKSYADAEKFLNQAISEDAKRGSSYCLLAEVAEQKNEAAFDLWQLCQDLGDKYYSPEEREWIKTAKERVKK
jgi:tetratricopeptide (TPR) repeat protein